MGIMKRCPKTLACISVGCLNVFNMTLALPKLTGPKFRVVKLVVESCAFSNGLIITATSRNSVGQMY